MIGPLLGAWHIQKREGTPFDWWHHGHKPMSPVDAYTPSNDLNQAVEFAGTTLKLLWFNPRTQ